MSNAFRLPWESDLVEAVGPRDPTFRPSTEMTAWPRPAGPVLLRRVGISHCKNEAPHVRKGLCSPKTSIVTHVIQ